MQNKQLNNIAQKIILAICWFVFCALAFILSVLPHKAFLAIVKTCAFIFACFDTRRKKNARANLDFIYENRLSEEEKQRIIKKCYNNFAFIILDFIRLSALSRKKILQKVTLVNDKEIEKKIPKNKPIILITAHYGHWELASLCAGLIYGHTINIGRAFKSKILSQILFKAREHCGSTVINKQGGLRRILKEMAQGHHIAIVVDQNTSDNEGEIVNFFEKKVRHTPTAAILARKFETAIVPVFMESNDDYSHFTAHFYEPIFVPKTNNMQADILQATQQQADITQKAIEKKPDEWLWFHRRFKNQYKEIYE